MCDKTIDVKSDDRDKRIASLKAQNRTLREEMARLSARLREEQLAPGRPPIVCLCGSTRFVEEFNRQARRLTIAGEIVLSIEIVTSQTMVEDPQHADPALKVRLDELHLRKIDLADRVFVLNVGGYIGDSTRAEIEYAEKIGKPIEFLEEVPL